MTADQIADPSPDDRVFSEANAAFERARERAERLGVQRAWNELVHGLLHISNLYGIEFEPPPPEGEEVALRFANVVLRHRADIARTEAAEKKAHQIRALIEKITQGEPWSLESIAIALNDHGIPAPRGGIWSRAQVRRVLRRTGAAPTMPAT